MVRARAHSTQRWRRLPEGLHRLRELAALGHAVVEESAREIIRERRAAGLPPRPEPKAFASELLRRDTEKYGNAPSGETLVFFDRCLVEAVAMAQEAGVLSERQARAALDSVSSHPRVFVLPPWQRICVNDAERDHSFGHCQRVHEGLTRWYAACGYQVHEVPRLGPPQRARHVLRVLAEGGGRGFAHRQIDAASGARPVPQALWVNPRVAGQVPQ